MSACRLGRLLLLPALLTSCAGVGADDAAPNAAPMEAPAVTLFGAPDAFAAFGGRLRTGQPVALEAVPGFETRPGQAFFFSAVASDGTLFVANMTQSISEHALTGCEMVITCFHPEEPTCFDERSGAPARFANLRIPAVNGRLESPTPCPSGRRSEVPPVRGGAVDDVEVIVDEHGVERVVFDSFAASIELPPPPDHFPMFGSLWKQGGAWRVDPASLRIPKDFAATPAGAAACADGICGAAAELAVLPVSKRIVINQYVGGWLMVTDAAGQVLASHRVPFPKDWCDPSVTEPYIASMRQVNADPTSALGDERFVVAYEGWGPTGQQAQEFSYDERTRRIRPVTAPFHPSSPLHPAPTCGNGSTVVSAIYDDLGNLWLSALDRGGAWRTTALAFAQGDGRARLERECSYLDPASGAPRPWGAVCEADYDVAALDKRSPGEPLSWSFDALLADLAIDPARGTVLAVLQQGTVFPIERRALAGGGTVFIVTSGLALGANRLEPAGSVAARRFVVRGSVDAARRALWLPVGAAVPYTSLEDDFLVGQRIEQHLVRVDLDRAFARGGGISEVTAPDTAPAGRELVITVRAAALGPFRRARSLVELYPFGSATPSARVRFTEIGCERDQCLFSARIPPEATAGTPGLYRWHAGLVRGPHRAHLVGRIRVE